MRDISIDEFLDISDSDDYAPVTDQRIEEQSRWNTYYSRVYRRESDGTFWELRWSRGSTEYQDDGIEDRVLTQVERVQKWVDTYEPIES